MFFSTKSFNSFCRDQTKKLRDNIDDISISYEDTEISVIS